MLTFGPVGTPEHLEHLRVEAQAPGPGAGGRAVHPLRQAVNRLIHSSRSL
jgi:hypothetical protein